MHNIKRSIEYAGQGPSVFVKQLTAQSVLAAIRSKWAFEICASPAEHDNWVKDQTENGAARGRTLRENEARDARKSNYASPHGLKWRRLMER